MGLIQLAKMGRKQKNLSCESATMIGEDATTLKTPPEANYDEIRSKQKNGSMLPPQWRPGSQLNLKR